MSVGATYSVTLPFLSEEAALSYAATHLLTQGGGSAIRVDETSGLNEFQLPAALLPDPSYASSFANSITPGAFAAVQRLLGEREAPYQLSGSVYGTQLEKMRLRLRDYFQLPHSVDIVFAASPANLDFVSLALGLGGAEGQIAHILLGMDEADAKSEQTAVGCHPDPLTPLGDAVEKGAALDPVFDSAIDTVPVDLRDAAGDPVPSEDLALTLGSVIEEAQRCHKRPIVRLVHGTRTRLIAPDLAHLDALRRRFGQSAVLIVDATQGRISRDFMAAYLARGVTVLLSGSKFFGGPPESAFALVPASARKTLQPLPPGYARYFSRHEWPANWPGAAALPDVANMGLLTRLCAALYEIELYSTLPPGELRRVVHLFGAAAKHLMRDLDFSMVGWENPKSTIEAPPRPLELQTSIVMDTSRRRLAEDHLAARGLYLQLINAKLRGSKPVRLGPPIKCNRLPNGQFGGNLTLSLSAPQIVEFSALESGAITERLTADFEMIGNRIRQFT